MHEMAIAVNSGTSFIESVFEKNIEQRKIILNEDITSDIVEKAIMQIIKWNEEDDANGLEGADRKRITMYINSSGGEVNIGFCLCNVMENSKTEIETITLGTSASMAAYIAMAGTKGLRKCYPFSTYLVHAGSMVVGGNANEVEDTVKYYTDMKTEIAKFVYRHSKITPATYKKKSKVEWFFSSKEAKRLGVVDVVIGE